tara:strand:- start:653 stop:814 length:162 start_codon:yes stop_codon:yes gene_type:complete
MEIVAAMSEIMDKLTTVQSNLLDPLIEHHRLIEESRVLKEKLEKNMRFESFSP